MNWINRIHRLRQQWLLRHNRIPSELWQRVAGDVLDHYRLDHRELAQLRDLASLFLHRKAFSGVGGLELDDYMCTAIAAEACLPILNLGMDYYDGWHEIIIYPDSFMVTHEYEDEIGVVHEQRAALDGEAWHRGPVILAWEDARPGVQPHGPGTNLILHEFAHKLDMLDDEADALPPLHADMDRNDWIRTFRLAYRDLQRQVDESDCTAIDAYGAESPAEFFAVVTEAFFELPDRLSAWQPELYRQLCLFYRQDPLRRY